MHQKLSGRCEYLGVNQVALFQTARWRCLPRCSRCGSQVKVITTLYLPLSRRRISLLWNGIKPVFVDVDPVNLNRPIQIEAAITPQTTAIMPVHCYGHRATSPQSSESPTPIT